jgi:peptide/nickel transport system substrate-binding protein
MSSLWLTLKNFFFGIWIGLTKLPKFRRQQIPNLLDSFSRKEIYTFVSALLVFVISGGFLLSQTLSNQGGGPSYGGKVSEGLVGQPQFINPVLSLTNNVDTDLSRIVYAQLLRYDQDQTLTPDLAESLPTVSADQKTYTLKLRSGLRWQDGKPLTADDVLFTIHTIQNADYESPLRPNWLRVRVEKIDDLTLTFVLREVSISFMNNFTLAIMPKHIWEGLEPRNFRLADANLKPVGSGPFVVRQIRKTADGTVTSMSLSPNSFYYQGRPYLDEITFKFYESYEQLVSAYQGREINSLGFLAQPIGSGLIRKI